MGDCKKCDVLTEDIQQLAKERFAAVVCRHAGRRK
jgi:hypothetical protein